MLEDFISPIDATVVSLVEAAGVKIVGRAGTSEFGISGLLADEPRYAAGSAVMSDGALLTESTNVYSTDSLVADGGRGEGTPAYPTSVGGASNAGNADNIGDLCDIAEIIKQGKADFALCNDYTGAISREIASKGLFYLHPTYGTVSRYGLIPSASSMDQIGIICKSPKEGFDALKIISGFDPKDGAMLPEEKLQKIAKISAASPDKVRIEEFIPIHFELYPQIMQILCCAELSNNISRYDGIKYGYRAKEYTGLQELYAKSRTEAFGSDVKLAAILGAMVLSQENYVRYYDKAMRLRRQIKDSLEFDKYDVIVTGCPMLSRLCGLPSLTTPECIYIADAGREDVLDIVGKGLKGDAI